MLEPSDARLHTRLVISESAFLLVLISVSILPIFPALAQAPITHILRKVPNGCVSGPALFVRSTVMVLGPADVTSTATQVVFVSLTEAQASGLGGLGRST